MRISDWSSDVCSSDLSPMKLFEYMAAKHPIVASATPANREIVSEQEAFLYEPDNTDALIAAVRQAIEGGETVRTKTAKASSKVIQWTWKERAKNVQAFLRVEV